MKPKNPYQAGWVQNPEDWFKEFKSKVENVMKGAKEFTWQQYCPHLDKIVQLSTEPNKNECELCIKDKFKDKKLTI